MKESRDNKGLPQLMLTIELGQEDFGEIISRVGIQGWNELIRRLIDSNNAMTVWQEGQTPPPVSVFFHFHQDISAQWPDADFRPVYFSEPTSSQAGEKKMPGIFCLPPNEFLLPNALVTCLINIP